MQKKFYFILILGFLIMVGGYGIYQRTSLIDELVYGHEEAPIEIVNYTSFQCPPCARFHETYADVFEKYLESGDIKLVIKAVDLEKFEYDEIIYEHLTDNQLSNYHELSQIYAKQDEWYDLATEDEVIELLGLNKDGSKGLAKQIKQNSKERIKLGINGVPTTFMNGEELKLGISADELEVQILSLLNQ